MDALAMMNKIIDSQGVAEFQNVIALQGTQTL